AAVSEGPQDHCPVIGWPRASARQRHRAGAADRKTGWDAMAQSASRKKAADIVPPLAVGVLMLIAWETFCRALAIPPYLFPMPSVIAQTFLADTPPLLPALSL